MARRNWTEGETYAALELYLRTPFGRIHSGNSEIIELAELIDRSANSVALKLANFASLDESLPRTGMSNASALDRKIWQEFFTQLLETGRDIQFPENLNLSAQAPPQSEYEFPRQYGRDAIRLGRVRINQSLFRKMVLASYDNRCAVSGIARRELLIAGHIKPWASDPANRLNPYNGICLNRLHDAAFEEGLMTFKDDGRVVYSSELDRVSRNRLESIAPDGQLRLPSKFKPDPVFLRYHQTTRFRA